MTESAAAAIAAASIRRKESSPRPVTVNVLCLGMSYVDWNESIAQPTHDGDVGRDRHPTQQPQGVDKDSQRSIDNQLKIQASKHSSADRSSQSSSKPTWRDAVEAVRRYKLSVMDGRDLARCLAVESLCDTQNGDINEIRVYTASQEEAAVYRSDRHVHGNFGRRGWARRFADKFPGVQFDQVVLDYFWIPPGWDQSHWTMPFFEQTLPDLCRHNLLRSHIPNNSGPCATSNDKTSSNLGGTSSPTSSMHVGTGLEKDTDESCDNNESHRPAVYLPFTLHCFRMIMACRHVLLQYYDVSFVRQDDLHQILLWKGTQQIGDHFMQTVLGKRLDQENVYCNPGHGFLRAIQQRGDSAHIASHELLECARRIPHPRDVRFIALRPVVFPATSLSNASETSSECGIPTRGKMTAVLPGRILGLVSEGANESSSKETKTSSTKRSLDFDPASVEQLSARQQKQRLNDSGCTGQPTETLSISTPTEEELYADKGGKKSETSTDSADDCTRRPTNVVAGSVDDAQLKHTSLEVPRAALVTPTPLPASSPRRSPRLATTTAAKRKLF